MELLKKLRRATAQATATYSLEYVIEQCTAAAEEGKGSAFFQQARWSEKLTAQLEGEGLSLTFSVGGTMVFVLWQDGERPRVV